MQVIRQKKKPPCFIVAKLSLLTTNAELQKAAFRNRPKPHIEILQAHDRLSRDIYLSAILDA